MKSIFYQMKCQTPALTMGRTAHCTTLPLLVQIKTLKYHQMVPKNKSAGTSVSIYCQPTKNLTVAQHYTRTIAQLLTYPALL